MFANCSEEEEIYPHTIKEIAKVNLKQSGTFEVLVLESIHLLCKYCNQSYQNTLSSGILIVHVAVSCKYCTLCGTNAASNLSGLYSIIQVRALWILVICMSVPLWVVVVHLLLELAMQLCIAVFDKQIHQVLLLKCCFDWLLFHEAVFDDWNIVGSDIVQ